MSDDHEYSEEELEAMAEAEQAAALVKAKKLLQKALPSFKDECIANIDELLQAIKEFGAIITAAVKKTDKLRGAGERLALKLEDENSGRILDPSFEEIQTVLNEGNVGPSEEMLEETTNALDALVGALRDLKSDVKGL